MLYMGKNETQEGIKTVEKGTKLHAKNNLILSLFFKPNKHLFKNYICI